MSLSLECKKAKRTGFIPAFLCGGILAAAVPIVNMAVRSEMYVGQQSSPMQILMGANWQMMAMLNILLVVAGSCLLYHTEFADNAMQKMKSLPIRESSIFFGKFILTSIMSVVVLAVEAASIAFCVSHWFEIGNNFWLELGKNFEYPFLKEVDSLALANVQLHLEKAYKNFFREPKIGFPRFKSKHHSRNSYTTNVVNGNILMESKRIRLPKLKWVAMKKHREPAEDFRLKSVTVSMEPSGKYFASLLYEGYSCENQAAEPDYSTATILGIDYAMQGMAVFSEKIEMEEAGFFRKNEKRLAREQRKLSRCVRGSHNYELQIISSLISYLFMTSGNFLFLQLQWKISI